MLGGPMLGGRGWVGDGGAAGCPPRISHMDFTLEQLDEAIPFAKHLGVKFSKATPEEVVATLEVRQELRNGSTALHGGVLMGLADTVASTCAFLNLPAGVGTTTTDATSRFLRPITDGFATATAVPLKVGRTLIILEVEVRDDHGKLAVKTSQTQIVLNR